MHASVVPLLFATPMDCSLPGSFVMDKGRYLGSRDLLLPCILLVKFFIIIIFMTVPHGMWDLSSLIRD